MARRRGGRRMGFGCRGSPWRRAWRVGCRAGCPRGYHFGYRVLCLALSRRVLLCPCVTPGWPPPRRGRTALEIHGFALANRCGHKASAMEPATGVEPATASLQTNASDVGLQGPGPCVAVADTIHPWRYGCQGAGWRRLGEAGRNDDKGKDDGAAFPSRIVSRSVRIDTSAS